MGMKSEMVLIRSSDTNLSGKNDELKCLRPTYKSPTSLTIRILMIKFVESDSLHCKRRSVINRPVTSEQIEITFQKAFKLSASCSCNIYKYFFCKTYITLYSISSFRILPRCHIERRRCRVEPFYGWLV